MFSTKESPKQNEKPGATKNVTVQLPAGGELPGQRQKTNYRLASQRSGRLSSRLYYSGGIRPKGVEKRGQRWSR